MLAPCCQCMSGRESACRPPKAQFAQNRSGITYHSCNALLHMQQARRQSGETRACLVGSVAGAEGACLPSWQANSQAKGQKGGVIPTAGSAGVSLFIVAWSP